MKNAIAFLVGFGVSVFVAVHAATFFEHGRCLDAGGKFDAITGACSLAEGTQYVALFSRPDLYVFWAGFMVIVFVPGFAAFLLMQRVHSPTRRSSGTLKRAGYFKR